MTYCPAEGLDPHFICMSPRSADPHTIQPALIAIELARELSDRRKYYPGMVKKGQMSQHDAHSRIDLLDTIHNDVEVLAAFAAWRNSDAAILPHSIRQQADKADAAMRKYRWSDIVLELRKTILHRRKYYPKWIEAKTLDPIVARHQLERLEAAHFCYWRDGRYFMPDNMHGHWPALLAVPAQFALFKAAAHAHFERFDRNSKRGEYADEPAIQGEPQLAFA